MTFKNVSRRATQNGLLSLILCAVLTTTGCSVNPATGKNQLMLISEAQEIAMGKEADPQIIASMGLYDDPEIQEYVSRLGQDLAAESERPNLEWHFRVVDDPLVNAFALPGGYIYITRGIMANLTSEAELAAVLGHEIGHVVARHGANQMSKQQLASVGLAVGTVLLDPRNQGYGALANAGMQLAFLKFSRDDERQADDLGLRYIDRVGYDPRPMTEVFETLGRVSAAAGAPRGPGWTATHPAPENRVARLEQAIGGMNVDFTGRPVRRDEYFSRLAGMTYGSNPREGFFKDNVFYHPDLALQLTFPEGWTTQNARSAVAAISPNKDAIMVMTLAQQNTVDEAERAFFEESKVTRGNRWRPSLRGLQATGSYFQTGTEPQRVLGRAAFISQGDRVFRLLTYSSEGKWRGYDRGLAGAVESFQRLTDRRYLDVQPAQLEVVRLQESMSLGDFSRRYPTSLDLQTLAILNHVEEGEVLEAGTMVKYVVGGKIP